MLIIFRDLFHEHITGIIIIGKNELAGAKYRVKDMKTGKEELVKKESVVDFIKELI